MGKNSNYFINMYKTKRIKESINGWRKRHKIIHTHFYISSFNSLDLSLAWSHSFIHSLFCLWKSKYVNDTILMFMQGSLFQQRINLIGIIALHSTHFIDFSFNPLDLACTLKILLPFHCYSCPHAHWSIMLIKVYLCKMPFMKFTLIQSWYLFR